MSTPHKTDNTHANELSDGIVVLDKPSGISSMTAIAIIRRKTGLKAGHAGTLDPLATGVLVVGLGRATLRCTP